MRRAPNQRELFGAPPARPPRDTTPVKIRMAKIDETDAGIFLAPAGRKGSARWAPKSEVRAGEGLDANLYTMPRWVARERGWL